MKYSKSYCEEKGISTSELNESQRTLYYIAENMKMDKSISEEGYRHFQTAIKALEQEPCEDCISRDEAISRIEVRQKITCESDPYNYEDWTKGYEEGIDDAIAMINSVPSASAQPKKGKWMTYGMDIAPHPLHCSVCGWSNHHINNSWIMEFKRCPECGADMEVDDE